jgi:hypothetical protein
MGIKEIEMEIDDNFAIELTDAAKTYDEWLSIVRFGLPTLIKDQNLLMEVIVRRAQILCDENKIHVGHRVVADDAAVILEELNLKFIAS